MYHWDDLRFFLAAATARSLTEAARALNTDAATVSRRVSRLEAAVQSTLFIRSPKGLRLTASGQRLYADCAHVQKAVQGIRNPADAHNLGGTVRISASEGFGVAILAPAIAALHKEKPTLKVELAANAGFLSAAQREVDIAVTLNAPNAARLLVEPLTDYRLGLFAAEAYLQANLRIRSVRDLAGHRIVGYVEDQIYAPELRYLDEIHPDLQASVASTSIEAQRAMVSCGAGVGVLPLFLAEGLVTVLPTKVSLTRRFWLSTHKEVAETARVRFIRNWMKDLVARAAARLGATRAPRRTGT
ncbi:MAG: LysR family transcriptional regulator [Pseudomonadota bacterium]